MASQLISVKDHQLTTVPYNYNDSANYNNNVPYNYNINNNSANYINVPHPNDNNNARHPNYNNNNNVHNNALQLPMLCGTSTSRLVNHV